MLGAALGSSMCYVEHVSSGVLAKHTNNICPSVSVVSLKSILEPIRDLSSRWGAEHCLRVYYSVAVAWKDCMLAGVLYWIILAETVVGHGGLDSHQP